MKTGAYIDARQSMYPCQSWLLSKPIKNHITIPPFCTLYGFVVSAPTDRTASIIVGAGSTDKPKVLRQANQGQYFCHATGSEHAVLMLDEGVMAFAVIRHGFRGQGLVGGPIEMSGRLCYIDNCSDSLLVYPPRKGDPSLNHLSFPAGVRQSFHIHPSIRLGVVASGSGFACFAGREIPLTAGTLFCIEERELHRFRTDDQSLNVIVFHPDGDWGPTDQAHPMLNRTYLSAAHHG
ncbi:cupin domain-containing protein [Xanthomonas albilineans]|uniref:cupin domain-containing protein n=1 Tax=Xanthomonas albilineans TaxID=29447 RepID=UPI000696638C|nr:AraC family ligand binding domain-containing protein [Xanthomonas albilineans]PPU93761.1 hypothetical protein XalbCFBP2523_04730 [Xanthomonas albilineans]